MSEQKEEVIVHCFRVTPSYSKDFDSMVYEDFMAAAHDAELTLDDDERCQKVEIEHITMKRDELQALIQESRDM